MKKGDWFFVCFFGCSSWTGGSQPQSAVLNTHRSYYGFLWHIWHGICLLTNKHPVSLCPRYIHTQVIWEAYKSLSDVTKVLEKICTEVTRQQVKLNAESSLVDPGNCYKYRLSFNRNEPCVYLRGRTAQSPPHLLVNGLQALFCPSEFVHIQKDFIFFFFVIP